MDQVFSSCSAVIPTISGKTKLVGLVGWPVEHTLSPLIQNTAFAAAGLDYVYVPLAVRPEDLPQAFSGLRSLGFEGVNVTVPHKVAVMSLIDAVDRSAELVGAVNTVVFTDKGTTGYNTDMAGFSASLEAQGVLVNERRALVIGAGGAARAVVCGLLEGGVQTVVVGARSVAKVEKFAASFDSGRVRGYAWDSASFTEAVGASDIVVNCTPIGMYPHMDQSVALDWEVLPSNAVVCDLIYNPPFTKLLTKAKETGRKVVGGAGMLVEQGALAFELWTGEQAPRQAMYQALRELVANRS
ncbi:MAG: ydiB [Firmicutes bacterium]|nr:ydiB [Bacillota bacterium]